MNLPVNEQKPSFSGDIKEEIARKFPDRPCCRLAMLFSLVMFNGIQMPGKVLIKSFSPAHARLAIKLLKSFPGLSFEWNERRYPGRHRATCFEIILDEPKSINSLAPGKKNSRPDGVSSSITRWLERNCCQRSFIRGAFLGVGSINAPEKGYHVEWVLPSRESAALLLAVLEKQKIQAKLSKRRGKYVVYCKQADDISTLLVCFGAYNALFRFEERRIIKITRGGIQRAINCDFANIDRVARASARQSRYIRLIKKIEGFGSLRPQLAELAALRLKYQQASLKELGALCIPPVSKDIVRRRLEKLEEIGMELEKSLAGRTHQKD